MIKTILKFIILSCSTIFLCGSACEKMAGASWGLRVENKSDKDVLFVFSFDVINGKLYPSTEWPNEPKVMGYDIQRVGPNIRRPMDYPSQDMGDFHPANTEMAVFVFDPDTVAKYSWKQLEVDQNYLKKFSGTISELANNLVYP